MVIPPELGVVMGHMAGALSQSGAGDASGAAGTVCLLIWLRFQGI